MMLTLDQIHHWYHRNVDVKNRIIYFGPWQAGEEMLDEAKEWEVNDWSVANLIKGLYLLDTTKKKQITIIWLSYGGDWDAGMAVYDYIKHLKSPVTMKCYGRVRSMGTVILQSCDERILSPNSYFMIHYGSASYESSHAKDFEKFAEELTKSNKVMEKIYLEKIKEKHSKYTLSKLQDLMKYDNYMSPKKAVELGLADKILGE